MPYYITIFEGPNPQEATALVAMDDQALALRILEGIDRLPDYRFRKSERWQADETKRRLAKATKQR